MRLVVERTKYTYGVCFCFCRLPSVDVSRARGLEGQRRGAQCLGLLGCSCTNSRVNEDHIGTPLMGTNVHGP